MTKTSPEVFFSEESGVRHLHLGTQDWIQGSMRVRKPFDIELEYVQRMMAWLLFLEPDNISQCHAMQLGLGAGAITKFCYKKLRMHTTAVEINPQVVAMCQSWFSLPQADERLHIVISDARDIVNDPSRIQIVDALCVDIYDDDATAPVLDSVELYTHCQQLLTDQGIMTVNLFGRTANFAKSLSRIARGFNIDQTSSTSSQRLWQFAPTSEGNTVVVALKSEPAIDRETMQQRAEIIETRWGLPARKWVKGLKTVKFSTK